MYSLFVEGGFIGMSLLTILLIGLFFAAWKAPVWVKKIGLLALVFGIFYQLLGLFQICDVIQQVGDIAPQLVAGGFKVSMISTMYGLLIYMVSLIIRMVQEPRI